MKTIFEETLTELSSVIIQNDNILYSLECNLTQGKSNNEIKIEINKEELVDLDVTFKNNTLQVKLIPTKKYLQYKDESNDLFKNKILKNGLFSIFTAGFNDDECLSDNVNITLKVSCTLEQLDKLLLNAKSINLNTSNLLVKSMYVNSKVLNLIAKNSILDEINLNVKTINGKMVDSDIARTYINAKNIDLFFSSQDRLKHNQFYLQGKTIKSNINLEQYVGDNTISLIAKEISVIVNN